MADLSASLFRRDNARSMAGAVATRVSRQARYGRTVLILSHMRATSTALASALAAHRQVSGYGETHVPHDAAHGAGRLAVNLMRRQAWAPGARWQMDKVLHNRLDATCGPAVYTAHALFLIRAPGPSVTSLVALARRTGVAEGADPDTAARYYLTRLNRLQSHWGRFPRDRRLGLTSDDLRADPDGCLLRIGAWLGLTTPLRNRYAAHPLAHRPGGGDPGAGHARTAIAQAAPETGRARPDGVDAALFANCVAIYDALRDAFAFSEPVRHLG